MGCKPKILVEGHDVNIAQCPGCRRIGFQYRNILVGFDPEQFTDFVESYSRVDFDQCCVRLAHEDKVILHTCHPDIQFSFNRKEFDLLQQMFQQAIIMLEANRIIKL